MAYAGRTPTTGFRSVPTKDTFSGDGSTTAFTLSLSTRTNDVEVFVENVQQEPTTAYSISGTTLTFTSAPVTGTNNIYVIHRGELVNNGVHTEGANLDAGETTLDSLAVDTDTLYVDATNDRVGIGTSSPETQLHVATGHIRVNGTLSGGATLQTSGSGGLSTLSSNDASNNNFNLLQGTNNSGVITFSTRTSSSNYERMRIDNLGRVTMPYQPAFCVSNSNTDQGPDAYITYNETFLNRGSCVTLNTGTFTAPVDGAYFFSFQAFRDAGDTTGPFTVEFRKNNVYTEIRAYSNENSIEFGPHLAMSCVLDLSAGDTVRVYIDGGEIHGNADGTFSGFLIG